MSSIGSSTMGGSSIPETATSTPSSEPTMIGFVSVLRMITHADVRP